MTVIVPHLIAGLFVVAVPVAAKDQAEQAKARLRRVLHCAATRRHGQMLERERATGGRHHQVQGGPAW